MNPFDIFVLMILGYCFIRGIFRGLIKEIASIIGIIYGFYFANTYYEMLVSVMPLWLKDFISNTTYLNIFSFLILFCGIVIIVTILGFIIKKILNVAYLGWIDRVFGALFGVLKGVVIVSIILILITFFIPKNSNLIKDSELARHISKISQIIVNLSPQKMHDKFENAIESVKKKIEKSI